MRMRERRVVGPGGVNVLWAPAAAEAGALETFEAISAASALRGFPRPFMNTSASGGFFIVAKETKMIFARPVCGCDRCGQGLDLSLRAGCHFRLAHLGVVHKLLY